MCIQKILARYLALRYRVTLTPGQDGWSTTIAGLPVCIARGNTLEETLLLVEDAKRSSIEASLLREVPIPEPEAYLR